MTIEEKAHLLIGTYDQVFNKGGVFIYICKEILAL